LTRHGPGRLPGLIDRWQQKTGDTPDDRDDDQRLDERDAATICQIATTNLPTMLLHKIRFHAFGGKSTPPTEGAVGI
jgi:hypothetical protein